VPRGAHDTSINMSYSCGTLAHPAAFGLSTQAASVNNGKQNNLPKTFYHPHIKAEQVEAHWDANQKTVPTRLWGTAKGTKLGGETRPDVEAQTWTCGELWNCDSNIRKWTDWEVKRNAAAASHDVHRHDQITRIVLQPQATSKVKTARLCVSGVVSPDCCFLEAWGFDLGLRDRQGKPTRMFKPVTQGKQFRHPRSYNRDVSRIHAYKSTLGKTASSPGLTLPQDTVMTLRPEDIGGEAGEQGGSEAASLERQGRMYASRSCPYWDSYDHTCRREAAKMSCSIHSPSFRSHPENYAYVDELELTPAAIYTKKYREGSGDRTHSGFKQGGHAALRGYRDNSRRGYMSTI